jgi:glycosyltransferase involved in cell wall biosynthesis
MACGILAISFRCDYGPEDIITDKIDGLLVPKEDINELGKNILWMTNHLQECQDMGAQARKKVLQFKKEFVIEQWIKIFSALSE